MNLIIHFLCGTLAVLTAQAVLAAPELSSKEEAAVNESPSVDPSLSQAGTASSIRARLTSALRRSKSGAVCNGVDVLCAGVQGSVIVLPGAIVNGDLINVSGTSQCLANDSRCAKRKP